MSTTNVLKHTTLLMGVCFLQIVLFASYMMNVWQSPLALLIMVLVPVFLLVRTYQRERNWFNTASQTSGQIIDRRFRIVWGKLRRRLTVEYVLNGITYKYYSYHGLFSKLPMVGASYPLLYNPSQPAAARERGDFLGTILPWIAMSFSAILLAFISYYVFKVPDMLPVSMAAGK